MAGEARALPRVLMLDWLPTGHVRGRVESRSRPDQPRETLVTRDGERVSCSCPSRKGDCAHVRAVRDAIRGQVLGDMATVYAAIEVAEPGTAGHLMRCLAGLDDRLGRIDEATQEAREARTRLVVTTFGERSTG